jgi:hypothetical protein
MIEDAQLQRDESDLTHLEEILELHDWDLDPGCGTASEFEARSRANVENRCLHHHVFDLDVAASLVKHAGFEVFGKQEVGVLHLVVVARKPD